MQQNARETGRGRRAATLAQNKGPLSPGPAAKVHVDAQSRGVDRMREKKKINPEGFSRQTTTPYGDLSHGLCYVFPSPQHLKHFSLFGYFTIIKVCVCPLVTFCSLLFCYGFPFSK